MTLTDLIKQQQEAAIKNWRKEYIDYGMTPSTTDHPPEGFYDFVGEPDAVEPWIEDLISQTATQVVEAVVGMCEGRKATINPIDDAHVFYNKQNWNAAINDIITTLRAQVSEGDNNK